ncbi:MAG: phosphatase PAP2 family protein [Actinobacteria bacterium]|uniref:Phosphatase PAP2 family protein n=1 Tax=Candidatus Fonsibacter lacus TaxID=2576439 RepID=A0A965LL67_9PROT|nr:phosphatase PAP2 family protein [Candidatus Fonsibacter lacus]
MNGLGRSVSWQIRNATLAIAIFVYTTFDVLHSGPLTEIDASIASWKRPELPNWADWIIYNLDHLGLRGLTALFLLTLSVYLGRKFKTWRPFNLSVVSLLALNLIVGLAKLEFGRTKPKLQIDLLDSGGMSYPSGHASNAILTWGLFAYLAIKYSEPSRFRTYLATWSVAAITSLVVLISLFRNTHWFSDLIGGVSIGTGLLLLIVAIDRLVSSSRIHTDVGHIKLGAADD